MKLSIASAILSQALPVVAETKLAAWFASEGGPVASRTGEAKTELSLSSFATTPKSKVHRRRGLKSLSRVGGKKLGMNKKLTNEFPSLTDLKSCDPDSSDPDTGILSCGPGAICQPDEASFLGGFCAKGGKVKKLANVKQNRSSRNKKNRGGSKKKLSKVECDPNEADLGLLGCPAGQTCIEMDGSSKGGFCTPPSTSRNLQADYCKLCDGDSFYVPYTSDSTSITPLEGFGDPFTCLDLVIAAYSELPTGTTCEEASALAQSECGCTYVCDICGPGRYLQEATAEDVVSFPGYEAYTCSQVYNAGNTLSAFPGVSIPEGSCPALQETIGDACCYEPCYICPGSQRIFSEDYGNAIVIDTPGYESITTCGELDYAVYLGNQTIANDTCPALSAIAEENCCSYPAELCLICPGSQFIFPPDYGNAIVVNTPGYESITTCGELDYAVYFGNQTIANDTCPALSAIAEENCCSYSAEPCFICPGSQSIFYEDYGNAIVVNTPGYESITTCGELDDVVYFGNQTIANDTCPALSAIAEENCCSYFSSSSCDVCGYGSEIPYAFASNAVTIPGIGNYTTCYDVALAAYVEIYNSTTCPVLQEYAVAACCRPYVVSCDVCGYFAEVPFDTNGTFLDPTLGETSCYDVYYGSYVDGSIANETCSLVQASAAEACCVSYEGYYDECLLCGEAGIVSDGNFTYDGDSVSCEDISNVLAFGLLNATGCEYFTTLVASDCCVAGGVSPTDAPMDPPTDLPAVIEATDPPVASPVETGGPEEATAPPTEGSAASVAESRLMTMMAVGASMFYALN